MPCNISGQCSGELCIRQCLQKIVQVSAISGLLPEPFGQQTGEQLVRNLFWNEMSQAVKLGIRTALTLRQGHQALASGHFEVLEVGQMPEAFGQQTGEQLVRILFWE